MERYVRSFELSTQHRVFFMGKSLDYSVHGTVLNKKTFSISENIKII